MVGAITAIVGTEGHQVVTAYDGETAIRRWREEQPDVILLDLAMAGVDGFAVVRALRAEGAAIPVIVVSGERGEPAKVRALDMGADDYVTKPFGRDELLARVRAAVRRAALPPVPPGGGGPAIGPATLVAPFTIAGVTVDPEPPRHDGGCDEGRPHADRVSAPRGPCSGWWTGRLAPRATRRRLAVGARSRSTLAQAAPGAPAAEADGRRRARYRVDPRGWLAPGRGAVTVSQPNRIPVAADRCDHAPRSARNHLWSSP